MDAGLRAAGRDPGHPVAGMAGHFDSRRGNLVRRYLLASTLSSRFQHLHDTVADKQTKLDLPAAPRGAGLAEGDAVSAVDVALPGIDEAEYAVLDAILACRRRRSPQLTGPGRA